MPPVSVIICTHNPRPHFLRRVLDALKLQTLPAKSWELILVDNASVQRLSKDWDLSWHPSGRHVQENELGLTHARLRGISEARGEVLVFVDDDNILRPDFLANSVEIARDFPFLGAWGGNVEGDFEQQLPEWLEPHLAALAIRKVDRDYWSNYYSDNLSMPCGAGLCVRKSVAEAYARALIARPASKQLDRKGASLISSGDVDLALMSYDSGLGTGMFQRLRTIHVIPKERMTVDYLCRLLEAIEYSVHLLRKQRNPDYSLRLDPVPQRWVKVYRQWKLPEPLRSFAKAQGRGWRKAMVELSPSS